MINLIVSWIKLVWCVGSDNLMENIEKYQSFYE